MVWVWQHSAHNTTYHGILGCSPYQLLFGMPPTSPIDEWKRLNLPPEDEPRSVDAEKRGNGDTCT